MHYSFLLILGVKNWLTYHLLGWSPFRCAVSFASAGSGARGQGAAQLPSPPGAQRCSPLHAHAAVLHRLALGSIRSVTTPQPRPAELGAGRQARKIQSLATKLRLLQDRGFCFIGGINKVASTHSVAVDEKGLLFAGLQLATGVKTPVQPSPRGTTSLALILHVMEVTHASFQNNFIFHSHLAEGATWPHSELQCLEQLYYPLHNLPQGSAKERHLRKPSQRHKFQSLKCC